MTVGSKWGYTYTAGWQVDADPPEVKDLSAPTFARQLAETHELLGDRLSLYQIHSAALGSGVLDDPEVRAGLDELRSSGVRVGLTATGTEQAATIERALEVGGFDAVQATWNPLEPSAENALARAHGEGLGVIVKEALASGRLTARGHDERLAPALAAALAKPWVDVVLSGASTIGQLESNLSARELALDDGAVAALDAMAEPPERYWQTRSALQWT